MFKAIIPLVLTAFAASSANAAQWTRASSVHFKLITDANSGTAADIVRRFEQIRQVLLPLAADVSATEAPVPVVALTTLSEIRRFRATGREEGFYVSGGFGDTIVLLGTETYGTVFHEYVHLFLNRNALALPLWLDEGFAELYSTLAVSGQTARIGEPVAARLALLRSGAWMPLPQLFAVERQSREYNGAGADVYYAESWALAHMLANSEPYQKDLRRFLAELALRTPIDRAFQQVYRKDTNQVASDLRAYISRAILPVATLTLAAPLTAPEITIEKMQEPAAALVLADVLAQSGKKEDVPALLAEVARRHPSDPDVETGLGETALREGNDAAAQLHFDRAIQLGSRNAATYYDYATLLRDNESEKIRFRSFLERAVRFDPDYFNAQYLLGYTNLREGKFAEAARHLQLAASLSPSRVAVWEQLALAYRGDGKREQAMAAARMAAQVATSDSVRERTAALLVDVQQDHSETPLVPAPDNTAASAGAEPAEPALRAMHSDASVSGELVQVDCLDSVARLVIRASGKKLFVLVRDPAAVLLTGSGGKTAEFACGALAKTKRVDVSYRVRADATYGTAGDVTAIVFK